MLSRLAYCKFYGFRTTSLSSATFCVYGGKRRIPTENLTASDWFSPQRLACRNEIPSVI
jgi:hypothetical protein